MSTTSSMSPAPASPPTTSTAHVYAHQHQHQHQHHSHNHYHPHTPSSSSFPLDDGEDDDDDPRLSPSSSSSPPQQSQPHSHSQHHHHIHATLPSPQTERDISSARTAIVASISNLVDTELQSRAAMLHDNAAALDKQERSVIAATAGLRRETERLAREADVAARRIKELGNVQNWAEVLERQFLVLEETVRLANGAGSDDDRSDAGSSCSCSCSECGSATGDEDAEMAAPGDGDQGGVDGGGRQDRGVLDCEGSDAAAGREGISKASGDVKKEQPISFADLSLSDASRSLHEYPATGTTSSADKTPDTASTAASI